MNQNLFALTIAAGLLVVGCGDDDDTLVADAGSRDLGQDMASAADLGDGSRDLGGDSSLDLGASPDLGIAGDSGPAADAGPLLASWERLCAVDGPARATACGDTPDPVADCRAEAECLALVARPEIFAAIPACLSARACTAPSDDPCFSADGLGLTPTAVASAFRTDCLAKRSACPAGGGFGDDYCFSDIFTDEVIMNFDLCLDGTCAAASGCFDAVIEARAPGCF